MFAKMQQQEEQKQTQLSFHISTCKMDIYLHGKQVHICPQEDKCSSLCPVAFIFIFLINY